MIEFEGSIYYSGDELVKNAKEHAYSLAKNWLELNINIG